jgi:hypothetical protein
VIQIEGGDEAGLNGGDIRQAQILFKTADLRIAVANCNRQFHLCNAHTAS